MMKLPELLAPAGDMIRLKTALHFGADAVYFGGGFSLRAAAGGFDKEQTKEAFRLLRAAGKKGYYTLNCYAKNSDFATVREELAVLDECQADGVIVSDLGIFSLCKREFPRLPLHVSTQANTLNSESALFWAQAGAERIVAGRELSLAELAEIHTATAGKAVLEVFCHGAMCVSYSGRCLLSNYLTGRDGNRGACAQPCRWRYTVAEAESGKSLLAEEDERGVYLFSSRDLCTISFLDRLAAVCDSLKIEGRMKTEYYVGTVVNAYRRALDDIKANRFAPEKLLAELDKASHRPYTSAMLLGRNQDMQTPQSAQTVQTYEFVASVDGFDQARGGYEITQRNRFYEGDELEILTPGENFGKTIKIDRLFDKDGNRVTDAKLVCQKLYLHSELALQPLDMLRKKR